MSEGNSLVGLIDAMFYERLIIISRVGSENRVVFSHCISTAEEYEKVVSCMYT